MSAPTITAFRIASTDGWSLAPASARREWIDRMPDKGGYRCLPMTMAHQAGWVIGCPAGFCATWDGGNPAGATRLDLDADSSPFSNRIVTHFGHGVVTFHLPWLFRTSPGWALWARGGANFVKDGAQALEGIVETDWAPYSFTMNWKLTRPGHAARFEKGEPICAVTPVSLDALESFTAHERDIASDPALAAEFRKFKELRTAGMAVFAQGSPVFQKMYTRGVTPTGAPAAGCPASGGAPSAREHRTNLRLAPFRPAG